VTTSCRTVVEGLQGFLLQVEISQIIVHEADEPNAVVDLLDAEFLTSQHGTASNLFSPRRLLHQRNQLFAVMLELLVADTGNAAELFERSRARGRDAVDG
jgi:hypothetical protein